MNDSRPSHRGTKVFQTASHWGVYNVSVAEDGAITGVEPFKWDHHPSPINSALPEMVRSPLRIRQPHVRKQYLKRRGEARSSRGGDEFVPVTWDTALGLIEAELRRVKEVHGNEAIYGGSYGWASAGRLHHAPSVLKRFLGLHGGYVDKLGNHSFGAAMHIAPYAIGRADIPNIVQAWPDILEHTQLIVMFGGAHVKNTQISSGGLAVHGQPGWYAKAREADIQFVNVSPSREDVPAMVDAMWLPIRPNTDTALMLGIAHTLIVQKRCDRSFLETHCVGYADLESYILGKCDGVPKTAAWASEISDIKEVDVVSLALRMSSLRTLIVTSYSVQRADHGEQPIWMTIALASMLGQVGLPGGGFAFALASNNGVFYPRQYDIPRPTLDLGPNAVSTHIPVGRVSEMLLKPGNVIDYNGSQITLPDIRLIYSAGGNPFHHSTNLNRFLQAWQMPETVIVHEPWWTPAAKFADIVLPVTTTLERNDIQASDSSRYYIAMKKAIEPVALSRNDFDIFAELSSRLGFGRAYAEDRNEFGWLKYMYERAKTLAERRSYALPSFDRFWEEGSYEFPPQAEIERIFEKFRNNPTQAPLDTDSGRVELFSQKIASFGYSDCPPHPTWLEPSEWLGGTKSGLYPIHLLSNQPASRLHSQLDASSVSSASKWNGREILSLGNADADLRGLETGDTVRVFNDRGEFLASVRVVDHLRAGVAQIATGAWYDPEVPGVPGSLEKHGNPNVVTNDGGTSSLGQMSTAQTVLVQIELCPNPPPVSAFNSPESSCSACGS